jgi:hypothetical protein
VVDANYVVVINIIIYINVRMPMIKNCIKFTLLSGQHILYGVLFGLFC